MKIIDSAVRLASSEGVMDAGPWLALMAEHGVHHAVVAPSDEHVAVLNREGNDRIADLVKAHPAELSGLAVANPWYGKQALETLEAALESGLSGLYVNPARQGFHLTDHIIDPLIQACERHEVPVYCHTGTPICSMPFQLAELARRFPAVRFVMGHAAWSDFWYDVIPAAEQAENILVETSCTIGEMVRAFIESLGADRVIYGSGYPRSSPVNELAKIMRLDLPEDAMRKVMGDNASALWGVAL